MPSSGGGPEITEFKDTENGKKILEEDKAKFLGELETFHNNLNQKFDDYFTNMEKYIKDTEKYFESKNIANETGMTEAIKAVL